MASNRDFDIVLWGATGYTGRLVAEHLAQAPTARGLRWAIAGRSRDKLERVRAEAGLGDIPILIGDAHDRASLDALAPRARVVCTTVGPYTQHGSELVAACAAAGTSYCDLTGEVPWIRRMIDAHHDEARERGARIVHCCGFDSIPSDLGVLMLHDAMSRREARLIRVDTYYGETKGSFSGGTVASMLAALDEARNDREVRRLLSDPYALVPDKAQRGPDRTDFEGVHHERTIGGWTAPFLMASVNARIVRRSNALADFPYGREFGYRERMSMPPGLKGLAAAAAVTAGLAGFTAAMQVPALRKLIERRLPKAGEGPTPEQRAAGYFVARLIGQGRGVDGAALRLQARVADDRDPGYASTAVMLGESALCLAGDALPSGGGVLTPATAMGMPLIDRLRAAGMTWSIDDPA